MTAPLGSLDDPDFVLRSRRVVLPDGERPAAVYVREGTVSGIADYDSVPRRGTTDLGDAVLMPGLVDAHVHINEPGRTEWEGFESATRAAAAGGITLLVDMPLNSVPATTTRAGLGAKLASAEGHLFADVAFWGGVVPGNVDQLRTLWAAGVPGFKCFLVDSGVEEFPNVSEADLRLAMPILAELGAPLLVHAEAPGPIARAAEHAHAQGGAGVAGGEGARDPSPHAPDPRYASYLRSRPRAAEQEAIELMIGLCREYGTRVHIVHLASADAVPALRAARAEGLPITVETCPHYLHFAAEDVPDGATEFKCAPPIRERENRERLWAALGDGTIDYIASDHSPCPPEMKRREAGDFAGAWGGIASLQLGLSVVWAGARARGVPIARLVEWMCGAPARLAGFGHKKGMIAIGYDADLVAWSPDAEWTVDPARLFHRHKLTPYAGATLPGVVRTTWLRGLKLYHEGKFLPGPAGRLLRRGS